MKFSIIVPHYDQSISDELFRRGMNCLLEQTFKDFEVLVYHDGPTSRDIPMPDDDRFKLRVTDKRENNWGHGNRNRGIKKSKGEWIIHFNPDNVLYPYALEEINAKANHKLPQELDYSGEDIIIFPIKMMGMQCNGKCVWREIENASTRSMIFTGYPTMKYNIDAMQLVMKKNRWISYKGWYDTTEESDGNMYPRFVHDLGAKYCDKILGEHW
jgi:glycosyltransferase involved in cell wall biosynthesis